MRRAALLLCVLALGGCSSSEAIDEEIDAQKRRVTTVIEDPAGAVDREVEERLRNRGIDGDVP